jgi:hypothetical protein
VVDADVVGRVEQEVTAWLDETKQGYAGTEDTMRCTVTEEKGLPKVYSELGQDAACDVPTAQRGLSV